MYTFSSMRDHTIPKSLKSSNSAPKKDVGFSVRGSGVRGLGIRVVGFRGLGFRVKDLLRLMT